MRALAWMGYKYFIFEIDGEPSQLLKLSKQEIRDAPILGSYEFKPNNSEFDVEYVLNPITEFFERIWQ